MLMMNRSVSVPLFCFLFSGLGAAQTWEVGLGASYLRFGGQNLGSIATQNKQDDDTKLKGRSGFGARVTLNTRGYYGHEIGYYRHLADLSAVTRPDDKNSSYTVLERDRIHVDEISYNLLAYMMPRGERVRPYIAVGAQTVKYGAPNFAAWAQGSSRNYGANYGGGIKLRLFSHALIRADIRHYFGGKPYDLQFKDDKISGGILQMYTGSVGLSIGF